MIKMNKTFVKQTKIALAIILPTIFYANAWRGKITPLELHLMIGSWLLGAALLVPTFFRLALNSDTFRDSELDVSDILACGFFGLLVSAAWPATAPVYLLWNKGLRSLAQKLAKNINEMREVEKALTKGGEQLFNGVIQPNVKGKTNTSPTQTAQHIKRMLSNRKPSP